MDIIKTSEDIKNRYINYILSSFNLNNKEMNEALVKKITKETDLFKGPILEVGKNFTSGKSLKNLVDEGILSSEFEKLNLNQERPLYKHQEDALRKVIEGKNIIVTTGTGSGKTESFLYPILDSILREKAEGKLSAGVRAMILYPMNTLARDQIDRLGDILKSYPDITFGAYTGEVEHKYNDALVAYKRMYNKEPLKNELISREQIKNTPPNILITNYSMLEYLLLRPKDSILFNDTTWKYLVIDEAHMYTGAKAIEIGMLLRRLKKRVNGKGNIRCILTSASLGRGREDNPAITEFASKLCDEPFEEEGIIIGTTESIDFKGIKSVPINKYIEIYDNRFEELVENIGGLQEKLYDSALMDRTIKELYELIKEGKEISEIKDILVGVDYSNSEFSKILEVIKYIKKDNKNIMPLKYHLFIKSLEGGYAKFKPEFQIFFERKEIDNGYKVFEIGVCKNCNDLYIIGNLKEIKNKQVLEPMPDDFSEEYSKANISYFLVKGKEDIEEEVEANIEYTLCGKCGTLSTSTSRDELCNCGSENYITVLKNEPKNSSRKKEKKKIINTCISCGKSNTNNSIIKKFLISQDVATSIIAEGIYKNIDAKEKEVLEDDLFDIVDKQGSNKQLLVFSDSRQQAAFFASFFDNNYKKFLNRRLLIKVLKDTIDQGKKKGWEDIKYGISFKDILTSLRKELKSYFNSSDDEAEVEAYKALLYEFVNSDGKNSMEELGVINFNIKNEMPLTNINKKFNLVGDEFCSIMDILLSTLRKRGAFYDYLNLDAKQKGNFEYLDRLTSIVLEKKGKLKEDPSIISWNGEKSNRVQYLEKIFGNKEEALKFLDAIFSALTNSKSPINYLIQKGDSYKLDLEKFMVNFSNEENLYQCNKCHKITSSNVRGLCHSYRCDGKLISLDLSNDIRGNYYRSLYSKEEIEIINTSEHTAQLDKEKAREIQKMFIDKEINILSCSTTFEVGIDVGDLETVLMRNMPPTPANYAQRAGRAGRRSSSDAFCVTYASLRSHDFTHYKDPSKMIGGKVSPPVFDIENKKIALRHMSALVLSKFWEDYPEYFYDDKGRDKAIRFLSSKSKAFSTLLDYLDENKEYLINLLKSIFPENLHILIDDMTWSETLMEKCDVAQKEFDQELKELELSKNIAVNSEKYNIAGKIQKTIETIEKQSLIQFVSRYNLIPKYGFPVDTVNLETNESNINLNRDLQLALKEYAPGAEVVANKMLYTSRYLKKIQGKEERRYNFKICSCSQVNQKNQLIDKGVNNLDTCISCGKDLSEEDLKSYTIPEFGFIAESKTKNANKKPNNYYMVEKYYAGNLDVSNGEKIFYIKQNEFKVVSSKNAKMGAIGKGKGAGFHICNICGYGVAADSPVPSITKAHKNHMGIDCNSTKLEKVYLGYNYETDIALIHTNLFENLEIDSKYSVLYSILNGISEALEIDRGDIDGCFYYENNKNYLVIFDKVPGGAGHSKRLLSKENLEASLKKAYEMVKSCNCGEETSCYSCLRNYSNQNYHTKLSRNSVLNFFENFKI